MKRKSPWSRKETCDNLMSAWKKHPTMKKYPAAKLQAMHAKCLRKKGK